MLWTDTEAVDNKGSNADVREEVDEAASACFLRLVDVRLGY